MSFLARWSGYAVARYTAQATIVRRIWYVSFHRCPSRAFGLFSALLSVLSVATCAPVGEVVVSRQPARVRRQPPSFQGE